MFSFDIDDRISVLAFVVRQVYKSCTYSIHQQIITFDHTMACGQNADYNAS